MNRRLSGIVIAFLRKRWPERIEYVKSADCSLVRSDIPVGVKINSSLVDLNYSNLSPFPSSIIVYLCSKVKISLWTVRQQPVKDESGKFVFPEGFLLARNFFKSRADFILVFREEETAEFIVVQSGEEVSQFIKPVCTGDECDLIVTMVTREHGLQSPQVHYIKSFDERVAMLASGLNRMTMREFTGFWVGGAKGKNELLGFAGVLLTPILIFTVLYTLIQVGGVWFQQQKLDTIKEQLAGLQHTLSPLMKQQAAKEKNNVFWGTFMENETAVLPLVSAYQYIAEAVLAVDGHLVRWNGVKDHVTFTVLLENAATLMDILNRDKRLRSVRFDGAVRKDRKSGKEQATFSVEL